MLAPWLAQRTHGTTDPGGVWHPVHRRECLTILLGTYAENGQIIGTDDELHCIRYSLLVPVPPFLPIGICGSRSHQEPLYRTASFRVSETGCAINEGFFSQVYLCLVSVFNDFSPFSTASSKFKHF